MMKELFGSAADSAAVRAAASVTLCFRWRRLCSGELWALSGGEGRSLPSFQCVSYLVGEPGSLSAFLWRFLGRWNASESLISRPLSSATSVLVPRCRRASLLRRLSPLPWARSTPTVPLSASLVAMPLRFVRSGGATSNLPATVPAIRFCSRRSSEMVASISAALSVISSAMPASCESLVFGAARIHVDCAVTSLALISFCSALMSLCSESIRLSRT